jgi:hypothetical protein
MKNFMFTSKGVLAVTQNGQQQRGLYEQLPVGAVIVNIKHGPCSVDFAAEYDFRHFFSLLNKPLLIYRLSTI